MKYCKFVVAALIALATLPLLISHTVTAAVTMNGPVQVEQQPFDVGYFADHYIYNTPHRVDPVPREKLFANMPLELNININTTGEPLLARAMVPGLPTWNGPWINITIGSVSLPNMIPAGTFVNVEVMTISNLNSTRISGSWYHN